MTQPWLPWNGLNQASKTGRIGTSRPTGCLAICGGIAMPSPSWMRSQDKRSNSAGRIPEKAEIARYRIDSTSFAPASSALSWAGVMMFGSNACCSGLADLGLTWLADEEGLNVRAWLFFCFFMYFCIFVSCLLTGD